MSGQGTYSLAFKKCFLQLPISLWKEIEGTGSQALQPGGDFSVDGTRGT